MQMGHSIFKQRNIYYLNVNVQGRRLKKSLGTKDERLAKRIAKRILPDLIAELITGSVINPKKRSIPTPSLINKFLDYNHGWKPNTRDWYKTCLNKYFNEGLPQNPSYRAMVIRAFNKFINWAEHHNYHIGTMVKLEGGRKWEQRLRIFTDKELKQLLYDTEPEKFKLFIQFAYYTGCRRDEIRSMDSSLLDQSKVKTKGKKYRVIKITGQARAVLMHLKYLWDYKPGYVSHKFKKEVRRLGIKDARFHDLRRTFGYNLIKKGIPIFEVSKLLGHSNVLTTQDHYAPFLVQDTQEFQL